MVGRAGLGVGIVPSMMASGISWVELARRMFDNVVDMGLYSVNIVWPLGPKIDDWSQDMEYGDKRYLSAYEHIPHRK